MIEKIIHGPPEWIVSHFNARSRRTFGFWTVVFAAIGAVFFGTQVMYVTILSVVALIPNFTSETPTEDE